MNLWSTGIGDSVLSLNKTHVNTSLGLNSDSTCIVIRRCLMKKIAIRTYRPPTQGLALATHLMAVIREHPKDGILFSKVPQFQPVFRAPAPMQHMRGRQSQGQTRSWNDLRAHFSAAMSLVYHESCQSCCLLRKSVEPNDISSRISCHFLSY